MPNVRLHIYLWSLYTFYDNINKYIVVTLHIE